MNTDEIDPATLALIIQLQRNDIHDERYANRYLDYRGLGIQEDPDYEVALRLYQDELYFLERSVGGRRHAGPNDPPVARGEAVIFAPQNVAGTVDRPFATDEAAATPGQHAADRPAPAPGNAADGEQPREPVAEAAINAETPADEIVARVQALEINSPDQPSDGQPESSALGASRTPNPNSVPEEPRECISCQESHPPIDLAPCPCTHEYCRPCIGRVFQNSILDETMFPPRCCGQAIPVDDVRTLLSPDLLAEFESKRVEFETPNRIYCHEATCSTFIPPDYIIDTVALCPRCLLRTCTLCKGRAHTGECPEDPGLRELMLVANENGWQRCTSCERVLELSQGCYHMTCPCGYEFCYLCGDRWKTCPCRQWDNDRLMDRVNHMGRNWEAGVDEIRDHVLRNHGCVFHGWERVEGAGQCTGCENQMRGYHYICQNCHLISCRSCRFNRFAAGRRPGGRRRAW